MRLAPRLDGVLADRLRGVRDHQSHVELDDVAETVAVGTGPLRVVEGEERRLRQLVADAAAPALEPLAEQVRLAAAGLDRERRAAPFLIRRLDRVGETAQYVRSHLDPVDQDAQLRLALQRRGLDVVNRHRPPGHHESAEPLAADCIERRGNRRGGCRPGRTVGGRGARCPILSVRRTLRQGGDHRQPEPDQQARAGRQRGQLARGQLGAVTQHLVAATPADGAARARIQQAQVVVDLGLRADRRARIAQAVLLADGNGGTDAVNLVDIRLLHPVQELPRVGRQRFNVPPLPFRVDRVEGERRLPRTAHPGHDDQLPLGQRQVDVLEVVRPRAPE